MTSRADATKERKQAILDAALECFSNLGYDRTTLADIRARSGASTGSIYHHFASKERIAAALYLDSLRETQEAGLPALLHAGSTHEGIAALVSAYIDWVAANPAKARFLLSMRHADFLEDEGPAIDRLNDDVDRRAHDWFATRVSSGELPDIDPSVLRAIVFGPCRHWTGAWLAGRTTLDPDQAKHQLTSAARAALDALR